MVDFAKIKRGQSSSSVHLRLPLSMRQAAKEIARKNSTGDLKLTEADVYRTILSLFFEAMATKRSLNEIVDVFEKGGDEQAGS